MKKFNTELFRDIIEGALAEFSNSHPDRAIPKELWRSISKRASRVLMQEFRRRFGDPPDRLALAMIARREREILEGE